MEIFCKGNGTTNYCEAKLGQRQGKLFQENYFRVRMLQENVINGLIYPVEMEIDGNLYLQYEVSSLLSLDRLFAELKPNGNMLKMIISQLAGIICCLRDYLILADDVVLRPECLFIDRQGGIIYMICAPGYGVSIREQLKEFLEYIMKIFDYRDVEGINCLYGLYDIVNDYDFCVEKFIAYATSNDSYNTLLLEKNEPYEEETTVLYESDNKFFSESKPVQVTPALNNKGRQKTDLGGFTPLIFETIFIMAAMAVVFVKYFFHGRMERDLFVFICLFVVLVAELVVNIMFRDEKNLV